MAEKKKSRLEKSNHLKVWRAFGIIAVLPMFLRLNESTRFRNSSQIVVAGFSYLVGPRGAPFSPGGAGKRSSTLTPGSSGALDCDVLKPIQRPMKMIIIQNRSDTTAATLPASGAAVSLCQRSTVRAEVSSNISTFSPASASSAIFVRKNKL